MAEEARKRIDWLLVLFIAPILLAGLATMKSFTPSEQMGDFFSKQALWVLVSLGVFFSFSFIDFRFLRKTKVLVSLFAVFSALLAFVLVAERAVNGAKSWLSLGAFSFQPADFMKLALVLIFAKYFSRRHVEIKDIKHIFISAFYALIPFALILLEPDFGSALIILLIWLGMVLVSGISKTHLFAVFGGGILAFFLLWTFAFAPYQKARIANFLNPLANIHGSGYNAYQSTIAVGSGQMFGKGLGFGTQSRLEFLPEHETDFVFAAFAEEWGFIGSAILLVLYLLILWRILYAASLASSNFDMLFCLGMAIYLGSHVLINAGMNMGLLPVTGIPLPFMSYGGSHLLAEFSGLGIMMSMRKYARPAHRDDTKHEFLGI